jgi:acetyl-CoA synthetase
MISPVPGAIDRSVSCTLALPASSRLSSTRRRKMFAGWNLVIRSPTNDSLFGVIGPLQDVLLSRGVGRQLYLAGDGAMRDKETGYFTIMGRIDDVLNVSGHRMGTMEIESALVANTLLVAEAAVVGRPDDLTGEAVVAFVVLKGPRPTGEESKRIAKGRDWVGKEIGAIACPRTSDSACHRSLRQDHAPFARSIAKGEEVTQDVSTLENRQFSSN